MWKHDNFTLTWKIFREINLHYDVDFTEFVQETVAVKLHDFHSSMKNIHRHTKCTTETEASAKSAESPNH